MSNIDAIILHCEGRKLRVRRVILPTIILKYELEYI
jgi:hypothetical protein